VVLSVGYGRRGAGVARSGWRSAGGCHRVGARAEPDDLARTPASITVPPGRTLAEATASS